MSHRNVRHWGDTFWAGSPGRVEIPRKRLTLKRMKILGQSYAYVNEKFWVGR